MNTLIRRLKTLMTAAGGGVSVEAVLVFPILVWLATAMYTFYDVYRAQNATYRANYTISDMLSRETNAIDANYVNGLYKVFRFMTLASPDSWIRVTVLHCVSACDDKPNRNLDLDWSFGVNGARPLNDSDFVHYDLHVPLVAQGNRLILMETSMHYDPPFSKALAGFSERELVSHVVTRPQFAPLLVWDHSYDTGSGGNHSDNSEDHASYDDDPYLPPDS